MSDISGGDGGVPDPGNGMAQTPEFGFDPNSGVVPTPTYPENVICTHEDMYRFFGVDNYEDFIEVVRPYRDASAQAGFGRSADDSFFTSGDTIPVGERLFRVTLVFNDTDNDIVESVSAVTPKVAVKKIKVLFIGQPSLKSRVDNYLVAISVDDIYYGKSYVMNLDLLQTPTFYSRGKLADARIDFDNREYLTTVEGLSRHQEVQEADGELVLIGERSTEIATPAWVMTDVPFPSLTPGISINDGT